MEQRVSLITLGIADPGRARAFSEQLGWRGQEVEQTVFFQAGGSALVLWGRGELAADCGVADEEAGFGDIALAHNTRSADEVGAIVAAPERAGARHRTKSSADLAGTFGAAISAAPRRAVGSL